MLGSRVRTSIFRVTFFVYSQNTEVLVSTCYDDVHVIFKLYIAIIIGSSCDVCCHIPKYTIAYPKVLVSSDKL